MPWGARKSEQLPCAVEQGKEQHQPDQDIITSRIRKNGAAHEDCAVDPRKVTLNQDCAWRLNRIRSAPSQVRKPATSHQSPRSVALTGDELMLQPLTFEDSLTFTVGV